MLALAQSQPPKTVDDELVDADREFATAGATRRFPEPLGAMFADDVVIPLPSGQFARSKAQAVKAVYLNITHA